MLHYLFTNDLRPKKWPAILVESARLIRDDKVPSQIEDKSKNNYINTQQSYLCIRKGSKANAACCKGDVNAVILNFINRFQYPNARTEESFNECIADRMSVAPLRLAVQLMFVLKMIDETEAWVSFDELTKYIVCNEKVARGNQDVFSLASNVIVDRKAGIQAPRVPDSEGLRNYNVEWKHCPRQIREMFGLLEFVPFIKIEGERIQLTMPSAMNPGDAKFFFYIINNREMWRPPTDGDWNSIQQSYFDYMDEGVEQSRPPADLLSVALKLFEKGRYEKAEGLDVSYNEFVVNTRAEYATIDGDGLVNCDYDKFRKGLSDRQVANANFSKHTDEEKRKLGDFIADARSNPKDISVYISEGLDVPGVGEMILTNFLMRTRPDIFCTYSKQMHGSMKYLGLVTEDSLPSLTADSYATFKSAQTIIRDKMREMKVCSDRENNEPADYFTVNEFTWWLSDGTNKDLIKEKVMMKKWKSVNSKATIKNGSKKLNDAFMNDGMLMRLAAALRTKPFAILAGHSGTGKSQLVRRLAYMTCNNDILIEEGKGKSAPGNYCMVQVKPNWHDSTDLLGYYSEMGGRHFVNTPFVEFICKAYAYPDTPFFVCLDEMNLAPVEQYFAEYLSAVESMEKKGDAWVTDVLVDVDKTGERDDAGNEKVDPVIIDQIMKGATSTEAADWIQKHGLTIPKNLFVVGTVNMDETTCQFSRKVLDRAMTLLMNKVEFSTMAESKKPSEEELLDSDGIKFFLEGEERGTVGKIESELLDGINESLVNTPFVVAYRFANEYALYEAALAKLNKVDMSAASDEDKRKHAKTALDHVVMMKLLPRIHGEKKTVEEIFSKGRKSAEKTIDGLKNKLPLDGLSVAMMGDILARRDEYLTFWP